MKDNNMVNNNIKYLIFDYGDVLVYPITGHWFITPKFYELIKTDKIDIEIFNKSISKASRIISMKMMDERQEYNAFVEVYKTILSDLKLKIDIEDVSRKIAKDFVYSDVKHKLYNDVKDNIIRLSKEYKIIMLSDNWPCAKRLLKLWGIFDYFEKIYISSEKECLKKDRVFFDFPINEFNIKIGEAVFIDDKEELLDIAKEKGLETMLMDRTGLIQKSNHRIIHNLNEL